LKKEALLYLAGLSYDKQLNQKLKSNNIWNTQAGRERNELKLKFKNYLQTTICKSVTPTH
jgi:hypothetical protein